MIVYRIGDLCWSICVTFSLLKANIPYFIEYGDKIPPHPAEFIISFTEIPQNVIHLKRTGEKTNVWRMLKYPGKIISLFRHLKKCFMMVGNHFSVIYSNNLASCASIIMADSNWQCIFELNWAFFFLLFNLYPFPTWKKSKHLCLIFFYIYCTNT